MDSIVHKPGDTLLVEGKKFVVASITQQGNGRQLVRLEPVRQTTLAFIVCLTLAILTIGCALYGVWTIIKPFTV